MPDLNVKEPPFLDPPDIEGKFWTIRWIEWFRDLQLRVNEKILGDMPLTDHGILVGSGLDPITALAEASDGQIPIGDTGADPVLALPLGTANEITVTAGAGTLTFSLVIPLIVAKGGTGAVTLTDGGLLLGSGTGAITALARATNGQLPIGSTGADSALGTLTDSNLINTDLGAGSITFNDDELEFHIHAVA